MHRNLDRRVEVIVPILDGSIKAYLKNTVLDAYLRDETNARLLRGDGTYKKVARRTADGVDAQMSFVGLDISA
jgi:polyphosphate kinase